MNTTNLIDGQNQTSNDQNRSRNAFKNIRNYLAGQFIGATRDDSLLDEVLKCLFCKLIIENDPSEILTITDPFELAKQLRLIFSVVKNKFPEIYQTDSEILLDPISLQYVISELNFQIMDAESDPIGDAFEIFVGSNSKGNSGQFFTPRSVTKLLVKAINPKEFESVLDPACGAGGFLSSTCAYLEKQGVRLDQTAKNLFGIDKDNYLAQLSKIHITLLTGGVPTIINGDSISLSNGNKNIMDYLPEEGIDVILTNPPFGSRIVSANQEVLKGFVLAKKWGYEKRTGNIVYKDSIKNNVPPQVLFIERCISLLKPGGRLGMVLPESVISNKSYRNVVEYLEQNTSIEAIIGMPEELFKTSGKGGTHTKTSLLIAIKNKNGENYAKNIFMAEAKWCGQDSRGRVIPNNDLPTITKNLIDYKNKKEIITSNLGFIIDKEELSNGVLCPRYYDPEPEEQLKLLSNDYYLYKMSFLKSEGVIEIATGDEVGKLSYGTGKIPFIRTSDLSNWEIKSDPKHGVSRTIYDSFKDKQDVKPGDLLMVKDGTYLVGVCAIITKLDKEIIYQSHLYKIRVNENKLGIDSRLILAALTSDAVQIQIRSKQFTQDIIDSLGERINELILPIPKSAEIRQNVANLVEMAISKRVEARELTKKAKDIFNK